MLRPSYKLQVISYKLACGQAVQGLCFWLFKGAGLGTQTTAFAKYLTCQVFFVRRFTAGPAFFTSAFNQLKAAVFDLLNIKLYPLSPTLMVTTK